MRAAAKTPTVTNKTLTNANEEYSHAFGAACKYWSIQCRTAFDVRYAFVTGKVAGPTAPYMTLKSGGAVNAPENWENAGGTLYLASAQAGVVVEILEWE